jgi:16S rRNA pseudouridine516 synthase
MNRLRSPISLFPAGAPGFVICNREKRTSSTTNRINIQKMRLDKFLSHATVYSRAQVKKLIRDKRVQIGEVIARSADYMLAENDRVLLDGEQVCLPVAQYFMLNKPAAYVCANSDSDNPTVLDLIEEAAEDLAIAGRLDKDTTGLVLLSNNGQWVHRIISPRRECPKMYHADLDYPITDDTIKKFKQGFFLKGEEKLTKPAILESIAENKVSVVISEGRYHQVKRMFAACGLHVQALHRVSVGDITLDNSLEPGQYRVLTAAEINSVLL